MAKHIWTVLCQKAPIDKDTNELSLHSVIEELTLRQQPPDHKESDEPIILAFPMTLVSLWVRSNPEKAEKTTKCKYVLSAPDGNETTIDRPDGKETVIDLTNHLRLRTRINLGGLPYRGPGMYYFKIRTQVGKSKQWRSIVAIPLRVVLDIPES